VLVALLDGLIDRLQRAPLMRKPPAQCTPEEQHALAALLSDLMTVRQTRISLENVPGPRLDQVAAYWPELAELLGGSRKAPTTTRPRAREAAAGGSDRGNLFEGVPPAEPEGGSSPPGRPAERAAAVKATEGAGPDLAHLLLEALTVQGRALNTTQMLAWLAERGTQVTREEVTTTLFRHEELFRKRGPGHWVVASQEGS
jgi:hypothetical protein